MKNVFEQRSTFYVTNSNELICSFYPTRNDVCNYCWNICARYSATIYGMWHMCIINASVERVYRSGAVTRLAQTMDVARVIRV